MREIESRNKFKNSTVWIKLKVNEWVHCSDVLRFGVWKAILNEELIQLQNTAMTAIKKSDLNNLKEIKKELEKIERNILLMRINL